MQIKKFNPEVMDLNQYAGHIHELNLKWWTNADGTPKELDKGERFMLMVSELAEAMEGDRKSLADDKLPQYPMIWVELADCVIRVMDSGYVYGWDFNIEGYDAVVLINFPKTVGASLFNIVDQLVQLATDELNHNNIVASQWAKGIVVNCEKLASELGCPDFWQVVYEKLVFNWTRADHAHENRQGLPGQKRY